MNPADTTWCPAFRAVDDKSNDFFAGITGAGGGSTPVKLRTRS